MTDAVSFDIGSAPFRLQDAEGTLWALARNVTDCVKLIDLDGRVVRWNAACEGVYGWSAHEVIGTQLPHVPSEMRLRSLADIRSIAAAGQVVERDMEAVRADGSRLYMSVVVIPVVDSDGDPSGVLSVGGEVSLDQRLERQRAEFTALIGRRLAEPLASLASNARLLGRSEVSSDPGRRTAIANSIAKTAESSAHFLESLIVTSGIESGRVDPVLEPVELAELVTKAAHDYRGRVLVDFDPVLSPVLADARLLRHAVGTMLEVADRVTPEDEHISASVHSSRGAVLFEVCDGGPALAADESRLLLKSPYLGTDVRGGLGGGMSLSFAAKIAHAHQARFSIRPMTPHGARYTMEFDTSLPRKDARQA